MRTIPSTHYIIYADDDNDDRELLKECFYRHAQNVELLTFQNGLDAFAFLNSLSPSDRLPCLVILDINMPVMNGHEVVKKLRLRKVFDRIPIVLFTTSSQPYDKFNALNYNAGFMTKPLNYSQMDAIAESFIGHCDDEVRNEIRKKVQP